MKYFSAFSIRFFLSLFVISILLTIVASKSYAATYTVTSWNHVGTQTAFSDLGGGAFNIYADGTGDETQGSMQTNTGLNIHTNNVTSFVYTLNTFYAWPGAKVTVYFTDSSTQVIDSTPPYAIPNYSPGVDTVYDITSFLPANKTIDKIVVSGSTLQTPWDNGWHSTFKNFTLNYTGATISASPSASTVSVGTPFTVDVKVDSAGTAFNAAQANLTVSSNLSVTGLHNATSNSCNLQYTQTPTTSNPSFAGAIYGGSSTNCTVYRLTLTPIATGTGTITFSNGKIKAYADNSDILDTVQNGSFTINASGATPTATPGLNQLTISSLPDTYHSGFTLTGTKDSAITSVFVNGSATGSAYPTSTTWTAGVNLTLGANTFTLYGSDGTNQTATQQTVVNLHTLGDINGDGVIDLTDASLFAVDWGKTSGLTYNLSDMNDDGAADLTDLSILAKLEQ
jgi:hypothetical protein